MKDGDVDPENGVMEDAGKVVSKKNACGRWRRGASASCRTFSAGLRRSKPEAIAAEGAAVHDRTERHGRRAKHFKYHPDWDEVVDAKKGCSRPFTSVHEPDCVAC